MPAGVGPMMQLELERYGLASLGPWLSNAVITGMSEEQLMLELFERPEFKQRFPAISQRAAAGLTPISPEEYIQYEGFARATARQFGVDVTQDEINASIAGDVSVKEIEDRLGIAARVVYETPPEVKSQLSALYDLTAGDMIRYWLNPRETLPTLQKRFFSAQISAESVLAGVGQLTAEQAGRVVEAGITAENAREGLQQIGRSAELFEATDMTEEDLSMDVKLGALIGDPEVTSALERRQQRRTGYFQGGGSFATGRTGVGGLGSANR